MQLLFGVTYSAPGSKVIFVPGLHHCASTSALCLWKWTLHDCPLHSHFRFSLQLMILDNIIFVKKLSAAALLLMLLFT
jgi:hypothetical protein